MSQRTRVLALLRHAGERGVTNSEFVDWRIFRYAARLHELREEGYEIRTKAFGSKVTYTLVSEAGVDDGRGGDSAPGSSLLSSPVADRAIPAAVVSTGTLFEVEHKPLSPYDREAA
jgi:Helix-turn-helix domain